VTCGICGRQLEETQDHAPMPCVCVLYSLEAPREGAFCRYCGARLNLNWYCGRCERET
jgi:hypothetical protein